MTDDDALTDLSSANKTTTPKSSSLIQSFDEDQKLRHDRINNMLTSKAEETYKQQENFHEHHVSDTLNKHSELQRKTFEHNQMKGQLRVVTYDRKVSLRDDPTSKPYFTKLKQSLNNTLTKPTANPENIVITSLEIVKNNEPLKGSQIPNIESFPTKDKLPPHEDSISSPYFTKVYLKGLDESENLSVHDVLQQFHSFKASLTSLKRPLTHVKLSSTKKSSLPLLDNELTGMKMHNKPYEFDNVNEVATKTDESERKSILLGEDKKVTEKRVRISTFKLPSIEPISTAVILEKYGDDKVQTNLIDLCQDPESVPNFNKTSLEVMEANKTKFSPDKSLHDTLFIKAKYKFSQSTSISDSSSRLLLLERQTSVKLDDDYKIFPKDSSFQDKTTKKSESFHSPDMISKVVMTEDKERAESPKKVRNTENSKSIPYFTKLKPIETSHTKQKTNVDCKGKKINSKITSTSAVNSDFASKKSSLYEEAIAAEKKLSLQHDEKIKLTYKKSSKLSKYKDPKPNIFSKQDVCIHTSLTSLKSALRTTSLESVASSIDDSSKLSAELSDVPYLEDISNEDTQQSVHEEVIEEVEEVSGFKESPLHLDQSFVVHATGSWGKPLPKDPGSRSQINEWELKTTRRLIRTNIRHSINRKRLESKAGSIKVMEKRKLTGAESSSSFEYENYGSYEEGTSSSTVIVHMI